MDDKAPAIQKSGDEKWTPEYLKSFVTDLTKNVAEGIYAEKFQKGQAEGIEALSKGFGEKLQSALMLKDAKQSYGSAEARGLAAARVWRLSAFAKGSLSVAQSWAEDEHKKAPTAYSGEVVKTLSAGISGAGGAFIPPAFLSEVIELLRPLTVVRSLGARSISLANGALTIPKHLSTASFTYVGENQSVNASQGGVGNITLTAKKGRVSVPLSNDFRRYSGIDADAWVRDDMIQAVRVGEDSAFLRGAGTEFTPRGIRYLAGNTFDANATDDLTHITDDLGKAWLYLEEANVPFTKPGWIFAPRTRNRLMTIRDANGNFAFRPEMLTGTLWGIPWRSTTQIPRNLGSPATKSEVILADFDSVIIGDVHDLEVEASSEAAYVDATGNLVSAWANDQTVMRGIVRHDIGCRHAESIVVITSVPWGA